MAKKILPTALVVKRQDITDDLMKLWLKPPQEFQSFKPGQYCTIGINGIERPYSVVSAPHEALVEIFLELIPDKFRTPTSLTPKLWKLHEGDNVSMRQKAKGTFLLDELVPVHVMISTVTGVAPFVSMLRAMRNGYYTSLGPYKWFHLFQGASYFCEFGYNEELETYDNEMGVMGEENHRPIFYIPTVSRPDENLNKSWTRQTGRVNVIVEDYFDDMSIRTKDATIYLCGNEGMVDDLGNTKPTSDKPLGKLIAKGYNVKQEIFF